MGNLKVRKPAVRGQFYFSSADQLRKQIASFLKEKRTQSDAIACMLPHAGYMYSGAVAAKTLASVNIADKVILIGPNHTGYGARFSVMAEGEWETPFGNVVIDSSLARQLLKHSRLLQEDTLAHTYEHSLEVELPLLQYLKPDFQMVPVVIGPAELPAFKEIGRGIAEGITEAGLKGKVLLVASSDMTHYEAHETAKEKDKQAIDAILKLDEDALVERIARFDISMCGYAPVAVTLAAAKALGAASARLITYQTSGDTSGDYESVVGYAGMVIQ
jgi:MEMO1 family protein